MRDVFGPGTTLGYCTNVHAGTSYAATLENLERHALAVKAAVSPDEPMGIGLWLPEKAMQDLIREKRVGELKVWLSGHGLIPFTFNGFPQGDFHEPVVKHRVYAPHWGQKARLEYTLCLANILAELLPEGAEGSISTLPVGWAADLRGSPDVLEAAAANLTRLADRLAVVEGETGHLIHVDLEPEPGCYLDTSSDVVSFFVEQLFRVGDADRVRRHLRVCHDVCHAAVMFEDDPVGVMERYAREGIQVGKVQLSSAVRVDFDGLDPRERAGALEQLSSFAEDRYLHQTAVRQRDACSGAEFFEDLPAAIRTSAAAEPRGEWRVHFHVPLYVERFGLLRTTQDHVSAALAAARDLHDVRHVEAETYAWDVLPEELRMRELAEGIARELLWVRDLTSAKSTS